MHARSLVIITLLLGKKKSKYYSVYILDAQGINKFYFLDESLKNELVQGILCKSMKKEEKKSVWNGMRIWKDQNESSH